VLLLVARSKSNQEIADALVITLDTIKKHVSQHVRKTRRNQSHASSCARARYACSTELPTFVTTMLSGGYHFRAASSVRHMAPAGDALRQLHSYIGTNKVEESTRSCKNVFRS
jgi:hypothetical protein